MQDLAGDSTSGTFGPLKVSDLDGGPYSSHGLRRGPNLDMKGLGVHREDRRHVLGHASGGRTPDGLDSYEEITLEDVLLGACSRPCCVALFLSPSFPLFISLSVSPSRLAYKWHLNLPGLINIAGVMGLVGWPVYRDGVLHHKPVPPSIEFVLEAASEDQAEKLELLCDIVFNIDVQVTPELTRSGRLRPFVYCWMGTLLRYWPVLLRRFKRESKANDALCRAVIMSRMSDQKFGSAERWLNKSIRFDGAGSLPCGQPHGGVRRAWKRSRLWERGNSGAKPEQLSPSKMDGDAPCKNPYHYALI